MTSLLQTIDRKMSKHQSELSNELFEYEFKIFSLANFEMHAGRLRIISSNMRQIMEVGQAPVGRNLILCVFILQLWNLAVLLDLTCSSSLWVHLNYYLIWLNLIYPHNLPLLNRSVMTCFRCVHRTSCSKAN